MKNLKLFLIICFLLAITIVISCKTKRFATTTATYSVTASNEAIAHGKDLVFSSCADCHYNQKDQKFTGARLSEAPGIIGKIYAANLTHSQADGIPALYTDAQLKYMLKTGVARDGRFLPYMLRPNMSDGDLNAIVAFLRSNDPSLAPGTSPGYTHINFIGRTGLNVLAKPLPYKEIKSRPTDKVALGYYLVDNLGCYHCHSKNPANLKPLNPDSTKGYLAGGVKLKNREGNAYRASNITPDKQTGIGNYTQRQFLAALRNGDAPDRKLHAPMPKFKLLKDEEIDAIYAYLQTVTPADHKISHE